jgi:recombination protein RecT
MTTESTEATPRQSLGQLVSQRKTEVQNIANDLQRMLPPAIPAEKFVRTVQTAITMNPEIAKCDKNSVLGACMKAASDGLILDGREAALVVYNAKQKDNTWKQVAQYIPMVTGIIKRVRNSGEVTRLNAYVVHKNDKFKVCLGLEPSIEHEPNYEDPGAPMGAYAIARFKDGLDDFEFMSFKEIEGIRSRSRAKDSGPWKSDWEEMARKTVIRRLAKRLPMSSELGNVIKQVDDIYDLDAPTGSGTIDGATGEVVEKAPVKRRGPAAAKMEAAKQEPDVVLENESLDVEGSYGGSDIDESRMPRPPANDSAEDVI